MKNGLKKKCRKEIGLVELAFMPSSLIRAIGEMKEKGYMEGVSKSERIRTWLSMGGLELARGLFYYETLIKPITNYFS